MKNPAAVAPLVMPMLMQIDYGALAKEQSKGVRFGFGKGAKSKEIKRDPRRHFSERQKGKLWDMQKGLCAGKTCKDRTLKRLTVQYDHIIPWEVGGRTILENGQALCPNCHALKTAEDGLAKTNKKRVKKEKSGIGFGMGGVAKVPKFKFGNW